MSRHVTSTGAVFSLLVAATVMMVTSGYPYVRQRKADPFAALATTLRQQQQVQQQQQQVQQQQQQQQQRQQQQLDGNANYGYEEDYAGNIRSASAEDDLWRLEQLQRQLGRAAMMPFYGVRPQRSWEGVEEPLMMTSGDLEGHVVRQSPPVVEYGVPVDEVIDQGSVWYDDVGPASMQATADFGLGLESQNQALSDQKQAENELLLNTLAEYMLMYDSQKAAEAAAAAAAEAALPVGDKRTGSQQEEEEREEESTPTETSPTTTTPSSPTTTTATSSSSSNSAPTTSYSNIKDRQPPVEIGEDGTPMGQKEFPMMRPANPPRKQWLTTNQGKLDFTSKRHHFQNSQSEIITPEDRLTRELDSLKTKKN